MLIHDFRILLLLIFSLLLLYGFTKEAQIAAWEQKQLKKIKRAIYNLIVKYENKHK